MIERDHKQVGLFQFLQHGLPVGFVLRLSSTAQNAHPGPFLTVYGTEGTIEYNGGSFKYFYQPWTENFSYSTHSWPKATIAEFRRRMSLSESLTPLDGPMASDPVEYRSSDEDSTRAHVRNWIEAIRGGARPIEDVRFGHHAALVGHMCNLSYEAGRPVRWNKATRAVEV